MMKFYSNNKDITTKLNKDLIEEQNQGDIF